MTHDELLAKLSNDENGYAGSTPLQRMYALRAVVELANKQLETKDIPAEQVGWLHEGYNLAMDNVIDAIEKELQ